MKSTFAFFAFLLFFACSDQNQQVNVDIHKKIPTEIQNRMVPAWFDLSLFPSPEVKVERNEQQWREILSGSEFRILRNEGTEAPFINEYNRTQTEGVYICRACSNPVFSSVAKYSSSSGWPSFFAPLDLKYIGVKPDRSLWSERTEVHCGRCSSHLGHVFDDGPPPTGLRYCLNSLALRLIDETSHEKIASGKLDELGFILNK